MKKVDLNLLVVFDAIMREGSMTRAAAQLAMTQPAVSNAVARMRVVWNDPVFVKEGRGIAPTPFAHTMWDRTRPHLNDLLTLANPVPFDATSARRVFRIGVSDFSHGLLWLDLRKRVEASAPGIDYHAVPLTTPDRQTLLLDAEVDVALDRPLEQTNKLIHSEALFESHFVCAMRAGHPLATEPLSMDAFLAADHLLVTLTGEATGFVDDLLQPQGLRRRVAMTVNYFSLVPRMLMGSDLICIVPYETVAESACRGDLWVTQPPIDVPPVTLTLLWHKRADRDAGQRWVREQIRTAVQQTILALPTPDCIRDRAVGPGVQLAAATHGHGVALPG